MLRGGKKRVLIIRQDRVGDVVLSTALPREIKRQWPDAHVAVMLRPYTRDVYLHDPYVDAIFTDDYSASDRDRTFWAWVRELRRQRFTHALMLLPQARYNYMTFLAGIPVRVGVGAILFHVITGARWVMRHKYRINRHEADFSMDLARKIGVRPQSFAPRIHLDHEERARVAALRDEWGSPGRKLIGIHATSGGSAPNWPPSRYRELADRLEQDTRLRLLITDPVVPSELDPWSCPNAGSTLRQAILRFAALDALVSASTGPMHVCAALGVPTVALFCPISSCAPVRWGPLGNRAEIILPAAGYCQGPDQPASDGPPSSCPGAPHRCTFTGSGGIDVETVERGLTRVLFGEPSGGAPR